MDLDRLLTRAAPKQSRDREGAVKVRFPRRAMDVTLSAAGLVVFSPLLAAAALAVLLGDGRPVLFRQARVGKDGRPFEILKFRTMVRAGGGVEVTAGGDRRITRVGRTLRKYKIDELPQLWNVLKGNMSMVGPRPEVPKFVDLSSPLWQRVLSVKPGLTEIATLIFRNEEAMLAGREEPERYYRDVILPAKLDLNLRYLERSSPGLDCRLLGWTVLYSFFPRAVDAGRLRRSLLQENA